MRRIKLFALAWLATATHAQAQEPSDRTTPLFADGTPIEITLSGPIRNIVRAAERSTDAHPATLASGGETHAIELSARGVSRRKRENCTFPPLRIAFSEKAGKESLFHKQGRLKLVTHCNEQGSSEQTLLREYTAYRLYSALTRESHKVRLARMTYVDGDKPLTTRWGFLIEDTDDAARRVDLKEVDTGTVRRDALNPQASARLALFQFMIGNTDWESTMGPDPADCCHNTKLIGSAKDSQTNLTPVPYDFDNSGLVDAAYAVPNAILKIPSVKTRVYRGFCRFNDQLGEEVERFRAARPALEEEIRNIPGLEARSRSTMERYLASFFDVIGDPRAFDRDIVQGCR